MSFPTPSSALNTPGDNPKAEDGYKGKNMIFILPLT